MARRFTKYPQGYIQASKQIIVSERTTMQVRCIGYELGIYKFVDDDMNQYVYYSGTSSSTKFDKDLKEIFGGESERYIDYDIIFTISAKITRFADDYQDNRFNLVSPRIISMIKE